MCTQAFFLSPNSFGFREVLKGPRSLEDVRHQLGRSHQPRAGFDHREPCVPGKAAGRREALVNWPHRLEIKERT
jgi:hypothetical protein